jgi:hypothetical protein
MCKEYIILDEKTSNIIQGANKILMENESLIDENIRLRKQLHDTNENLKQIIAIVKTTKEELSEICGENQ